MDPIQLCEFLERAPHEDIRKYLLKTELTLMNAGQLIEFLRETSERFYSGRNGYEEVMIATCAEFPLEHLDTPHSRANAGTLVTELIVKAGPGWRVSALRMLFQLFSQNRVKVMQVCLMLAANGVGLTLTEELELDRFFLKHVALDADGFLKDLYGVYENYRGNPPVSAFVAGIECRLRLRNLTQITGPMIRHKLYVERLSNSSKMDQPFLVLGPSGCGKTTLVKIIHSNGSRKQKPFIEISCDDPAQVTRVSCINTDKDFAGSTVFLDEVHCLSKGRQQALLHGPERQKIQIVTASSLSVEKLTKKLMPDFHRRYCESIFEVPPLKDRRPDFVEFVESLVASRFSLELDNEVLAPMFSCHDWPRNYAEVENFVKEICQIVGADGGRITLKLLQDNLNRLTPNTSMIIRKLR